MSKVALRSKYEDPHEIGNLVMTDPIQEIAEMLVTQANLDHPRAIQCLEPLLQEGPTEETLQKLAGAVRHVELRSKVFLKSGKPADPSRLTVGLTIFAGSELEFFALATIRILMDGYLERIHRCQLEDCDRYFVGDPRSKWCSERCGSKSRVRRKRKKDRQ